MPTPLRLVTSGCNSRIQTRLFCLVERLFKKPQKITPVSFRKSRKTYKTAENNTQVLPGNPGNPTKSHKITNFLGEHGGTWVETVGIGDFSGGPVRAAKVSSGKSGWRVARYFDPNF